jgi:hypothetical protein
MKMMHKEVGFAEDMVFTKKCVFKKKFRCDTLDIQIRNLVHKQDLCTIQKSNKSIPCIDSKKTSLVGHFLWDMRSRPKM